MQRGFFIAGVAGQMTQTKLNDISHNMANVNTPGYLSSQTSFSTVLAKNAAASYNPSFPPAAYLTLDKQFINTRTGPIQRTGNELDFAIQGKGFFRIRLEADREALTRAGNFRLDADGNLLTQLGQAVLDSAGQPIRLPAGDVTATENGAIYVNGQPVAELGLLQIKDPAQIHKLSGGLFTTPKDNTREIDSGTVVRQGMLEGSNVNAVVEMARMIDALRSHQSMLKVVEIYNQQASLLNDRVGVVSG